MQPVQFLPDSASGAAGVIALRDGALISVLAGAAASLSGLENLPGRGAHLSAMGVALLVSGGLTLRNYFRQTQPPAMEE